MTPSHLAVGLACEAAGLPAAHLTSLHGQPALAFDAQRLIVVCRPLGYLARADLAADGWRVIEAVEMDAPSAAGLIGRALACVLERQIALAQVVRQLTAPLDSGMTIGGLHDPCPFCDGETERHDDACPIVVGRALLTSEDLR